MAILASDSYEKESNRSKCTACSLS